MTNRRSTLRAGQKLLIGVTLFFVIPFLCGHDTRAQKRTRGTSATSSSSKSITVRTEPNAIVWISDVRRGLTDASGTLVIKSVLPGRHMMRVRAFGFREANITLTPAKRGTVTVRLAKTTDAAELLFQRAETARESAKDEMARKAAAGLYRDALKLRPKHAPSHLGLARVLMEMNLYNEALVEIDKAHELRTDYAEASAVEGRILRTAADEDAAIVAFKRAIDEAKGFQPEAHTGLALVYQDKGEYDQAAAEFGKALAQLSDTEPILYQLLGAIYEKQEKYKEAVSAYEKYLALAPEGNLAPAIRSVMEQLRKQAEGRDGLPY